MNTDRFPFIFQPSAFILHLSGAAPLWAAARANRGTSLAYAVGWAWLAWMAWGLALFAGGPAAGHLALGLTGCAGVAVLGARRPGAGAWNFVVVGLLAVVLLPL